MSARELDRLSPKQIGQRLRMLRGTRGLSQIGFATLCEIEQSQVSNFERGTRRPTLEQLDRIAIMFDLPLQYFLTGGTRPGSEIGELIIELQDLGIHDLWVKGLKVPGAFRPTEELLALCVAGEGPNPRIVEAMPAALAWNDWDPILLRAYARKIDRRAVRRLAWLADVVLIIDQAGGFPGGCLARRRLQGYARRVPLPKPDQAWDHMGHPGVDKPRSPIWRRWRISYEASLEEFRARGESLFLNRDPWSRLPKPLTNDDR